MEGQEEVVTKEFLRRQNRAWLVVGSGLLVALATMVAAMWRVATGPWFCAANVCRALDAPDGALIGLLVLLGVLVMLAGVASFWRSRLV